MLNTAIIMGRLTRDIDMRMTLTGKKVVNFTLAVEGETKDSEGKKHTDFIDCIAWEQRAVFLTNYFRKGDLMIVSGRVQSRTWEDKEGKKHYTHEIAVEQVNFVPSQKRKEFAEISAEEAGDLPF